MITADVDSLKQFEEAFAIIPRHAGAAFDDIVAFEGADGNEADVGDIELAGEIFVIGFDGIEDVLAIVNNIHFVDGDNEVRDAEESADEAVAFSLGDDAVAGVNEDDRQIGG